MHYLALLEQKTRALDQGGSTGVRCAVAGCFAQLRRLLEARLHKHGSQEYVQVLRLLGDLFHRASDQRHRRRVSFGHHRLRRGEASAAMPDPNEDHRGWTLENYHLPLAQFTPHKPPTTMTLLQEAAAWARPQRSPPTHRRYCSNII